MITYVVLIPHDVQEGVHGQVIVSTAEARQGAKDAPSEEHAVQVLLSIRQQLLHLLYVFVVAVHLFVFLSVMG